MTMPFLIRHYRLTKKYGRKKLLKEFPQKNWSENELRKLLNKIDEMGDTKKTNKAAEDYKCLDQMQILTLLKI